MPSSLGIRRPPVGPTVESDYHKDHQKLHPAEAAKAVDISSTSPSVQPAVTKKSLPHLPDELWIKIWTFHTSDWINNSHFYIVDNGPWLINIWRGCSSCELPVGLGVSHFVRDVMLSVIRARGIQSWDDSYGMFEQWAITGEKFRTSKRPREMPEDRMPTLKFEAQALIDFRTWAKSCDMTDAPKRVKRIVWEKLPPVASETHYQQ